MIIDTLISNESINQRIDLIDIVRKGIPTKDLQNVQVYTSLTDKEISQILPISQRQLVRYTPDHPLNKEITAHLIQIVEMFQKGYNLFGKEKFQIWIRTQNKVLKNYKPIEIMDTSIGIEMIEDVIGRIEHGVYS